MKFSALDEQPVPVRCIGLIRRPPVKAQMGPSGIVKAIDISADDYETVSAG
jgi:hypothetical protein